MVRSCQDSVSGRLRLGVTTILNTSMVTGLVSVGGKRLQSSLGSKTDLFPEKETKSW